MRHHIEAFLAAYQPSHPSTETQTKKQEITGMTLIVFIVEW